MSVTQESVANASPVINRIRELCDAGLATKGEVGRYVLGETANRHVCCATVVNWLGGRTPQAKYLTKLKEWIAAKEKQMAKLCKPSK